MVFLEINPWQVPMNILLVNPNQVFSAPMLSLNRGLAYLAAVCKRDGHAVRVLDTTWFPSRWRATAHEALRGFAPDLVGFSVSAYNYSFALKVAETLDKTLAPRRVPFLWGGIYPTLSARDVLAGKFADVVCVGEGEETIPAYIRALASGKGPDSVAGLVYRDGQGRIIENAPRPFVENLDALPFPDYEEFDLSRLLPQERAAFTVLASRGCPFDCRFCAIRIVRDKVPGRFYRVRTAACVIEEIRHVKRRYFDRYAPRGRKGYIFFGDDTFGCDPAQLSELCEGLSRDAELMESVRWGCQTRPDLVTADWADQVRQAGCRYVQLGVESADETVRSAVCGKKISDARIGEAFAALRGRGIGFGVFMMLGCPGEGPRIAQKSLALLRRSGAAVHSLNYCVPFPGTPLFEDARQTAPAHKSAWLRLALGWTYLAMFLSNGFRLGGRRFVPDTARAIAAWARYCTIRRWTLRQIGVFVRNETLLRYLLSR